MTKEETAQDEHSNEETETDSIEKPQTKKQRSPAQQEAFNKMMERNRARWAKKKQEKVEKVEEKEDVEETHQKIVKANKKKHKPKRKVKVLISDSESSSSESEVEVEVVRRPRSKHSRVERHKPQAEQPQQVKVSDILCWL